MNIKSCGRLNAIYNLPDKDKSFSANRRNFHNDVSLSGFLFPAMKKLTQERLKELLHYDPITGMFTWIKPLAIRVNAGDTAGYKCPRGYIMMGVGGVYHRAHRLAWLYMYGYLPELSIDHINRVKGDNRISNLREASRQCNMRNSDISSKNTSGITGVSWHATNKRWQARITVNDKRMHLKTCKSIADAALARWDAEVKYGFPACNTTSTSYLYLKRNNLL